MAKPKMTIVEAYRKLDEILGLYRDGVVDTEDTADAIFRLNSDAQGAGVPFNLSITQAQLEATGLNPTVEESEDPYANDSEPQSSY